VPAADAVAAVLSADALRRCNGASIQFPELCQTRSERKKERKKERGEREGPFATAPFASSVGNTSAIFYPRLLTVEFDKTKLMRIPLSLSASLSLASPSDFHV